MPDIAEGVFKDAERAQAIIRRLGDYGHADFWRRLTAEISRSADPDRALANLERWMKAGGTPEVRAAALMDNPALRHRLPLIIGASQAISDVLVQNPELALILGDPLELGRDLRRDELLREGEELIRSAISFTHRLDRIRYLKQRALVKIVWHDLTAAWEPPAVWDALSQLADAILELASRVVWRESANGEPPVAVIAMGKHGSRELNYSSDIDLIYVADDSVDDIDVVARYCEKLTRAIGGKMGRGSLYRIDLRLRPLGKAGPIVQRLSPALSYYRNYAEPWEILAQIRSRPCAGNISVGEQFVAAVSSEVYRGARSDIFIEGIIDAKKRYEREVEARGERESNLKLGPGGIRDVEFITQLMQLILGHTHPELRGAPTVSAIESLRLTEHLSQRHAQRLSSAYTLLRQVEHRIQLRYDLQAHNLPKLPDELEILGRLAGYGGWKALQADLRRARVFVRGLLEQRLPSLASPKEDRGVSRLLDFAPGSPEAEAAERLVSYSDNPESLMREIEEHTATAERVRLISERAPRIVPEVAFHAELWDVAFSEEVELIPGDEEDVGESISRKVRDAGPEWETALASALRREFLATALKDAFHREVTRTFMRLSMIAEAALLTVLNKLGGDDIDVIALGRLGSREPVLSSDWDVMLLVRDQEQQRRAEKIGQDWIRLGRRIAMASTFFPIDTRLRPEGGAGLIVRSLAGFRNYVETSMETWERIAFTRARSLRESPETAEAIQAALHSRPWTYAEDAAALDMRRRIQAERLRPWEVGRDLKLGEGFLLDIEWLCGMWKLRLGKEGPAETETPAILGRLAETGVIEANEQEELAAAMCFYTSMRNAMYLLDFDSDSVLPENPDRLNRLAKSIGMDGSNAVLKKVEAMRIAVTHSFATMVEMGPQ